MSSSIKRFDTVGVTRSVSTNPPLPSGTEKICGCWPAVSRNAIRLSSKESA